MNDKPSKKIDQEPIEKRNKRIIQGVHVLMGLSFILGVGTGLLLPLNEFILFLLLIAGMVVFGYHHITGWDKP